MLGINKIKPTILILITSIFASCQPSSEDDFKQETKGSGKILRVD